MFREEQHPTTELLLRALDGELLPKEAKAIQRHLQGCWKCRAQSESISKAVNAYTEVFASRTTPQRLEPPHGWKGFPAKLAKMEQQCRAEEPRSVGWRPSYLSLGPIAFGVPIALLFLCAVLFWARFSSVQAVSAAELLRRASGNEQTVAGDKRARGIFQRVSFRWGHQALIRSSYRDFRNHRRIEKWEQLGSGALAGSSGSGMLRNEISRCESVMTKAELNVEEPLSPQSFRAWLQHQPYTHRESVFRSEHRFRVISEIDAGPVHQAELVLRAADYHAVQERFQFADDRRLEITELAYDVRPPTLSEEPQKMPVTTSFSGARHVTVRRQVPVEKTAELEQAEMKARMFLHREGADLGDQVAVKRSGNAVAVTGIVETPERKNELTDALKSVPHIRVEFQTINEAAAQLSNQYGAPTTLLSTSAQESPLLLDQMKAKFSDDQRRSYVSQVLSLSDETRSHAFALRELARRYPASVAAALPAASQQELRELAREHLRAIGEEQAQLQRLVSPFLNPVPDGLRPVQPSSWQLEADLLVKSCQREHEDLIALLAAGNANGRSADAVKRDLQEDFNSGPFLAP